MYRPRTRFEWIFIGIMGTQAVCCVLLELDVLLKYLTWVNPVAYQVPYSYVIPVNFGLFALGSIYQAILAFDALRSKNNLQLLGVCLLNISLLGFAIIRYEQTQSTVVSFRHQYAMYDTPFVDQTVDFWPTVQPGLLASTILVGICSIVICGLAYKLHLQFAWSIYRHINGSAEIRRQYLFYQILLVLMKVEPYFLSAFVISYGFIDVHYEMPEFALTMIVVPVVLVQIFLTVYFTKNEIIWGAIIAVVLQLGEIAYLISRIQALYCNDSRSRTVLKVEMVFFALAALVLAIFSCLDAILCMTNFNSGLKPLLLDPDSDQSRLIKFEPVQDHIHLSERFELD